MRTLQASSAVMLFIVAASASSSAWTAEDEASASDVLQGTAVELQASEDEATAQEELAPTEAAAEESVPVEDAPAQDTPNENSWEEPEPETRPTADAPPPAPVPVWRAPAFAVAPDPAPPPAPVVLEKPEDFRRRIQDARKLAERERKLKPIEKVPEGLSQDELAILGAEKNIAVYDRQIEGGEGTHAIRAFLRMAETTLADLRRQHLAKKWAGVLDHAEAPGVLRQHAQRMAALKRMRTLAEVKGYPGLIQRSSSLLDREKARFESAMKALQGIGPSAGGAAGAAASVLEANVARAPGP